MMCITSISFDWPLNQLIVVIQDHGKKIVFSRSIILNINVCVCVWHSPMSKLLFFICICGFNFKPYIYIFNFLIFYLSKINSMPFGCCSSSIVCTGKCKGVVKPVRYEQVVVWPVFYVFHHFIGMFATACTYHFVSSFLSSPEKWGIKWFPWIFNIITIYCFCSFQGLMQMTNRLKICLLRCKARLRWVHKAYWSDNWYLGSNLFTSSICWVLLGCNRFKQTTTNQPPPPLPQKEKEEKKKYYAYFDVMC